MLVPALMRAVAERRVDPQITVAGDFPGLLRERGIAGAGVQGPRQEGEVADRVDETGAALLGRFVRSERHVLGQGIVLLP